MRKIFKFVELVSAPTIVGTKAIPFDVDFKNKDVSEVWTLFDSLDPSITPSDSIVPVHGKNAFIEDQVHDWNITGDGKFRYYSRIASQSTWILIVLKD